MRNPGLAERTGRGVDLIFQGLLRYGRPEPDYSGSNASTVQVVLSSTEADLPFLKMIIEEENRTQSSFHFPRCFDRPFSSPQHSTR